MEHALAAQSSIHAEILPPCGVDLRAPVPAGFRFDSGLPASDSHVRLRLYGPEAAPLVIVAGGISSSRVVYAPDGSGWWNDVVAPGAAIDLSRWRVLAFDFAPLEDIEAAVTTHDQARLVLSALDWLGEAQVHAWVGASYGAMVGLAFAGLAPERLGRLCVISAAHKPSAMGVAWRGIQRRIVGLGRSAGRADEGLALARELAMTTYRSAEEFETRFDLAFDAEGRSDLCRYLTARGRDYPKTARPGRWAALSAAIDRHRVDPAVVRVPVALVASTSDRLTPIADMSALAEALPDLTSFAVIPSLYGHDAFLKDVDQLCPILRTFLNA